MLIKICRKLYFFVCSIIGIFFILITVVSAAENDFEKLRLESAQIKTLQAAFVQKKSMKILSKPLILEGRFFYAAPNSIRWEYLKPLRSIVITSGSDTKRYVYSDGKMVEDKTAGVQAMKIVLGEISGWMSGKFDQNASFKATISHKAIPCITLVPVEKSMAGIIEKIEITLSQKAGIVKSVKIIEGLGNFTQINFSKVKINEMIDPSVFRDVR